MSESEKKKTQPAKITLLEIMMIIMLVGVIFIFIVPFNQMKKEKRQDDINMERVSEALINIQKIAAKVEEYRKKDEFGAYPVDYSELKLGNLNTEFFGLNYAMEDTSVVATSLDSFGKKDIKIKYKFSNQVYVVENDGDGVKSRKYIKDYWLP